jgi:tetratricopeptide (TPR) repeat protein
MLDKTSDPATRREVVDGLRAFVRDTPAKGDEEARVARAALMAALVAAGGAAPDQHVVIELLDGFETRYPNAKDLGTRALEQRLGARVAVGDLAGASRDLDAWLAGAKGAADARKTMTRLGRDLLASAERVPPEQKPQALALARRVYGGLAESGMPADRLTLADLDLRAGDAAAARRAYEAVLASEPNSAEAIRGAARAAAAQGDRDAALVYWRRALEASTPGGTGWYEARIAQVELLAASGRASDACGLVRSSVGRATSAGADQLEARLRGMGAQVCK